MLGACPGIGDGVEESDSNAAAAFPDVTRVEIRQDRGTYTLDVTISSPYDSPERYADGWRVWDEDGAVLGDMQLAHDHAAEQPSTRTQTALEIPEEVDTVTVQGRGSQTGYGGATTEVDVPDR